MALNRPISTEGPLAGVLEIAQSGRRWFCDGLRPVLNFKHLADPNAAPFKPPALANRTRHHAHIPETGKLPPVQIVMESRTQLLGLDP